MSKKLKGVAFDLSPYGGGYGGDTTTIRTKHHSLFQDYQHLQKETEAMKNQLEAAKKRKATLLAEVGFLRRRHKNLTISAREREEFARPGPSNIQNKSSGKVKNSKKRDTSLHKLPPLPKSNSKGRVYIRKEASTQNNVKHVIDLNQSERIYSGNDASMRNLLPTLDLNEDTFCGKEASLPSRAPIFDLNEISTEEDDLQYNSGSLKLEDLKRSLMKGGNEDQQQHNDLKLSICRNTNEGSSRVGKRKISWQDPVALRV